jgi:hypothetical protein
MIVEPGRPEAVPPYPSGKEDPPVRIGAASLFVAARCPGRGEVGVEVWAGDPGPGWQTRFDRELETKANGFDVGEAADEFHLSAAPGRYRVRADVHLDDAQEADIVRFIFPDNADLRGQVISSAK